MLLGLLLLFYFCVGGGVGGVGVCVCGDMVRFPDGCFGWGYLGLYNYGTRKDYLGMARLFGENGGNIFRRVDGFWVMEG